MRLFFKKIGLSLSVVYLFSFFLTSVLPTASAHDFWVSVIKPKDGLVRANIGYGHTFPDINTIADKRVHIFAPLQLVTPDGVTILDQVGENYAYQKKMNLTKGSYIVTGLYQPTFWSNGKDGWAMTNRIQRPDADSAREYSMCAKTILNVQGATDEEFITKPVGQRLEIVPLKNPAKVKVEEKLPLQVLCDGKPVKTTAVEATFAGFSDKEYQYKAFSGRTDLKGIVQFIPLKHGYWIVNTKKELEHPDKAKADGVTLLSTLTFKINK